MRLSEIAQLVGGTLEGEDLEIGGVSDLQGAGPNDLSFVQAQKFADAARASRAGAVLCVAGVDCGKPTIRVANPKFAFIQLLHRFFPKPAREPGIHPSAVVSEAAELGEGVVVSPYAVIEAGAKIGDRTFIGTSVFVGAGARIGPDCELHTHACVQWQCELGARVILHPQVVIGADGFGFIQEGRAGETDDAGGESRYVQVEGPHVKVPQLGNVILGDDVEVGACSTIDRGTVGPTRVGAGTKIDNHVMIAHNCQIGEHVLIAACVGLSGGVKIGNHVTLAGQVGSSEGAAVGDFSVVGARAVLYPGKRLPERSVVLGDPAQDARDEMKQRAALRRLPDLQRRLRELERRLKELEQ